VTVRLPWWGWLIAALALVVVGFLLAGRLGAAAGGSLAGSVGLRALGRGRRELDGQADALEQAAAAEPAQADADDQAVEDAAAAAAAHVEETGAPMRPPLSIHLSRLHATRSPGDRHVPAASSPADGCADGGLHQPGPGGPGSNVSAAPILTPEDLEDWP